MTIIWKDEEENDRSSYVTELHLIHHNLFRFLFKTDAFVDKIIGLPQYFFLIKTPLVYLFAKSSKHLW